MMGLQQRSAFSDFFPEYSCETMLTNPHSNYYMFDCFIKDIRRTGHGSVLNYESLKIRLVIENCVFYNCSAGYYSGTINGGVIYFNCADGMYAFSKVCAYRCEGTYYNNYYTYGCFAYMISNHNNTVQQTTLSNCGPTRSDNYYYVYGSIYLSGGRQYCQNDNSSFNYGYSYIGLYSLSATLIDHKFITINSNFATGPSIYGLTSSTSDQIKMVQNSNVVNNTCSSDGVVYGSGKFTNFSNCVFTSNYYTLFSNTISVTNSYIRHTGPLSSGSAIVVSSVITDSPVATFEMFYFATAFCEIPTPAPTLEATIQEQCIPGQTLFPPPTDCHYTEGAAEFLNLNSIIHLMLISFASYIIPFVE